MSDHIRDRIARALEPLAEDRLYQVLDYVDFLASRYPGTSTGPAPGVLQRLADGLEDRLRAGGVAAGTVAEAMGLLNRAVSVLDGVAAGATAAATAAAAAAKAASAPPQSPPPPASAHPASAPPAATPSEAPGQS